MAHDMNDNPEFLNISARDQYQNVTSYPLVITNIAIENGRRNSKFSHQQVVIVHSYIKLPEGLLFRCMSHHRISAAKTWVLPRNGIQLCCHKPDLLGVESIFSIFFHQPCNPISLGALWGFAAVDFGQFTVPRLTPCAGKMA